MTKTPALASTAVLALLAALLGAPHAIGADVDRPPIRTITGLSSGIIGPGGVFVDRDGYIFTANAGSDAVTVHAPGASGDTPPLRTIAGDRTGLVEPTDVFVDAAGFLYVANFVSITVYEAGADGNVSPVRTVSDTQLYRGRPGGVAVDAAGQIYVTQSDFVRAGWANILVYAAHANGDSSPVRTINAAAGPWGLQGLALADGLVWVVSPSPASVSAYPANASGPVAPVRRLEGANTTLQRPFDVAVDGGGNVYVADGTAVDVFASGATGDTSPVTSLRGPATGLGAAQGLTVDRLHELTVADRSWAQAVFTFAPLVPVLRPSAVRELTVSGRPGRAARTVSWLPPTSAGNSGISHYRVVVKQDSQTVLVRKVAASATSIVLRKVWLRDGWQRVVVRAKNPAGLGTRNATRFLVVR